MAFYFRLLIDFWRSHFDLTLWLSPYDNNPSRAGTNIPSQLWGCTWAMAHFSLTVAIWKENSQEYLGSLAPAFTSWNYKMGRECFILMFFLKIVGSSESSVDILMVVHEELKWERPQIPSSVSGLAFYCCKHRQFLNGWMVLIRLSNTCIEIASFT